MTQTIKTPSLTQPKLDELILVVKRSHFFPSEKDAWHGLKKMEMESSLTLIQKNKEFLPRSAMELDPNYKQIIPYLIFHHEGRYFLMQRQVKASETRLQNKYTLGIGGHIRQEDLREGATIFDWARREFHEEVSYDGNLIIEPLGVLNDDSNDVGKVHIGFVFLLTGDSGNISVKSELKSGHLVPLSECMEYMSSLETWSQIALQYLK